MHPLADLVVRAGDANFSEPDRTVATGFVSILDVLLEVVDVGSRVVEMEGAEVDVAVCAGFEESCRPCKTHWSWTVGGGARTKLGFALERLHVGHITSCSILW